MSPREVIRRNLEFSNPLRFGMAFNRGRVNDFCLAGMRTSKNWQQKRWVEKGFEYYDDEWGNLWYRVQDKSSGGEIYKPALKDWGGLKGLKLPDFSNPERFKDGENTFKSYPDLYHAGHIPGFPFAICRYLRKMEVYFQDLVLERERIDELHEMVVSLLEDALKGWAAAGADGIFFCEDWGTQERLLIRPVMWREIFKPVYRRLCGTAHKLGLHILMHSCGYVWDILDDLAEAGVNCLQFDQPGLYGLERLAGKLQSLKICLFSPVDIQRVLPSGDKALIVREARNMVKLFSGRHGGFIAGTYGDLPGIKVSEEWDQWAYQAFLDASGVETMHGKDLSYQSADTKK